MTDQPEDVPAEGLNSDIEEPFGDLADREPGSSGPQVEAGAGYERAVLEDTVLPGAEPAVADEQGTAAPQFREPGAP